MVIDGDLEVMAPNVNIVCLISPTADDESLDFDEEETKWLWPGLIGTTGCNWRLHWLLEEPRIVTSQRIVVETNASQFRFIDIHWVIILN